MADKTSSPEDSSQGKQQDEVQLFTLAFNPKTAAVTFLGSMPIEQASGLIQQILRNKDKAQLRLEIETELKSSKPTPPVKPKKAK